MGLVITTFNNQWGRAAAANSTTFLQPARKDLWVLDMNTPIRALAIALPEAYDVDSAVNNETLYKLIQSSFPTAALTTFMARSVQLPPRSTGAGPVARRDNAPFVSPGYRDNIGDVQVTFAHELAQNYAGSSIWALLCTWRAFARAGQGPDFPNSPELTFSLSGATAALSTPTLISPYRYDFSVTLLSPKTGKDTGGATGANGTGFNQGPGYTIKNAWPKEFGLESLDYEDKGNVLTLKATFGCDDVVPETSS